MKRFRKKESWAVRIPDVPVESREMVRFIAMERRTTVGNLIWELLEREIEGRKKE